MRHRVGPLLAGVLGLAVATVIATSPATAAEPGVQVRMEDVPDEFTAGAGARTVKAVVSTDRDGRCRKVRWSLLLKVDRADLRQVRVDRIEQDGSFPTRVRTDGDTARITDEDVDPGELCRGRTVTASYRVAFAGDADEGEVRFQAQAFDDSGRLLQEAGATSRIAGGRGDAGEVAPNPVPSVTADPVPSVTAEPVPAESASEEPINDAAIPPADTGGLAATPASGKQAGLLGPGLIVGGVLVFAGVGLLMRIRSRARRPGRRDRRRIQHSYPY